MDRVRAFPNRMRAFPRPGISPPGSLTCFCNIPSTTQLKGIRSKYPIPFIRGSIGRLLRMAGQPQVGEGTRCHLPSVEPDLPPISNERDYHLARLSVLSRTEKRSRSCGFAMMGPNKTGVCGEGKQFKQAPHSTRCQPTDSEPQTLGLRILAKRGTHHVWARCAMDLQNSYSTTARLHATV